MVLGFTATEMALCPRCGARFEGLRFCPGDGVPLIRAQLGADVPGRPGQTIGPYRIIDCIGHGGMGTIYRVEHRVMQKAFAMKILHQELRLTPHAVRRFEREARACARIEHPHCVTPSDFGVTPNGSLFLTMELLEGKDLFDTLRDCGRFTPARAIHVTRQICAGLGEAHHSGVVHRDLKPENIFLQRRPGDPDFVKLLDFGIAKIVETTEQRTLTSDGTVFGTPEYLAPEQGAGRPADHRSDLYSVGVILYRMLSGRLPFRGTDKQAVIRDQMETPPTPFQRIGVEDVPPALEEVCFKLLAKDPVRRYQTAEDVRDALGKIDLRRAPTRIRRHVATAPKPLRTSVWRSPRTQGLAG